MLWIWSSITGDVDIDLDNLDFDDKEVYKMIGEGNTVGVFQLESAGMTSFMKELKPDCLEDIIAGISLYRPGPMAEIPRYISGKRDPKSVEYYSSWTWKYIKCNLWGYGLSRAGYGDC